MATSGYRRIRGELIRNGERRGWPIETESDDVNGPTMPSMETEETVDTPPMVEPLFHDLLPIPVRGKARWR